MKLSNPWPAGYVISPNGKYGPRRHPITGKPGTMHRGVDVSGSFKVTSAGDGVVVHCPTEWHQLSNPQKRARGGGNVVIIDHGAVHTVYYHGAQRSALRNGQRVKTGDFIFQSGTTGSSTGNHLHFEVRTSRNPTSHTDPVPYLSDQPPKTTLAVTGRPNKQTWAELQKVLKAKGHYPGRIDGIPGPMTYRGLQTWLGVAQTGKLDMFTKTAMQQHLSVKVDGIWGRMTWGELQRRLNGGDL